MEPPHERTGMVNPDIMQHEYLELVPPISTIDPHQDLPRHVDPLPHHGHDASPATLRHDQELRRADVPQLEDKIEMWRTHGRPRHPIWQYFTHAHVAHERSHHSPHVTTTAHDHMDVVCALCGTHIYQDHTLRKGEVEATEEIKMARSVLHGMWHHLASQCAKCPHNVRHDMATWHQLPAETLATPAAPASPVASMAPDRTAPCDQPGGPAMDREVTDETGGYEEFNESDDSTSHLLGYARASTP